MNTSKHEPPLSSPERSGLDFAGTLDGQRGCIQPRVRRRTLTTASVAGVMALVLVGSVAAWATERLWYASGTEPETAMPASVSMYSRIDLDPSLDQTVKALEVARTFSALTETVTGGVQGVENAILTGIGIDELSEDDGIGSWFDHRIGVGIWSDSEDEPYTLVVLSATDQGAATSAIENGLDTAGSGDIGYVVRDGWALLALGGPEPQAAAEEASEQARDSNLADDADYSASLEALPEGQVAVGWVDVDTLREDLPALRAASSTGTLMDRTRDADIPESLTGHLMVAAQATADGVEVRLRADDLSTTESSSAPTALPTLETMAADSVIAGAYSSASGYNPLLDLSGIWDLIGGYLTDFLSGFLNSDFLTGLIQDLINGIIGGLGGGAATESSTAQTLAQSEALSFAFTSVAEGDLSGSLTVDTGSDEAAASLSQTLWALAEFGLAVATVDQDGSTVKAATTDTATDDAAGTLADDELYRTTMTGMPETASAVLYADVAALMESAGSSDATRETYQPVKSIGVGVGTDGGDLSVLVRSVIG